MRIASLFSGCGGGDLGIVGGFEFNGVIYPASGDALVFANDLDKNACSTHGVNFGPGVVCGDVRDIDGSDLPEHDILVAGFPCQSFSIVGERKGLSDPRGQLFFEMVRLLEFRKPLAFIAENVKGLLNIDSGATFDLVRSTLSSLGYSVSYKLLNAADYGVPQRRERVFIVGVRRDLGVSYMFPSATHRKGGGAGLQQWVSLASVVDDDSSIDAKYFFSERAHAGLLKANRAFNKGRIQVLDQPCNTLSAHLAKVSLNGTDPVLYSGQMGKYRRFSPREAARIQSFPETFVLPDMDSHAYRQIGNAIPPVLMWHVYTALRSMFDRL